MLWTIFIILLTFWLVGVVSTDTLGGFIHILLVLAVVALVLQLMMGHAEKIPALAKNGPGRGTREKSPP